VATCDKLVSNQIVGFFYFNFFHDFDTSYFYHDSHLYPILDVIV